MKNIVLSAVAVLAMSSFSVAGGDIAPIEESIIVDPIVSDNGVYLGLAYGLMKLNIEGPIDIPGVGIFDTSSDFDLNTVMLLAGYKINQYVAVEARYWNAVGNIDATVSVTGEGTQTDSYGSNEESAFGVYIKPILPITDAFNLYALLGYASINEEFLDDSGFSWGVGVEASFTENISVFIDYVRQYDDTQENTLYDVTYDLDASLSSLNFGASYRF